MPRYEGSPADKREDRVGAKKLGITLKQYEKTAKDKKEDKKGQKRMKKKKK